MSHIITYTEEIEEHGYCQERPALNTGDRYLYEVDGKKRLRIVLSVQNTKIGKRNPLPIFINIDERRFTQPSALPSLSCA